MYKLFNLMPADTFTPRALHKMIEAHLGYEIDALDIYFKGGLILIKSGGAAYEIGMFTNSVNRQIAYGLYGPLIYINENNT